MSGLDSFLRATGMLVVIGAGVLVLSLMPAAAPVITSITAILKIVAGGLLLLGLLVALMLWRSDVREMTGRRLVMFGWVRRLYRALRRHQVLRGRRVAYQVERSQPAALTRVAEGRVIFHNGAEL
jgi:hypothetical protein